MGAIADQNPVAEQDASHIILVVEDEVLQRMMFTDQLREAGYRVLEASDADKALVLLRHDALNVAVVISDVDMPGSMNGIGLAQIIGLERPLIKTILVSGHEMPPDEVHHDAFFAKPYNAPAIILRIEALLNSER
jgi:two-component system, response regulator PdtaR